MRRKIYILFSHLINRPDSELREELVEGRHLDLFNKYDQFADAPEVPESWRPKNIPEFEEWDELWDDELNYNNPRINLIESVYKPWTVDESCQMPFADEKGFLMGDWAHHMLHLYEQLDFELPESFSHCPDHLMLELEFMSLLIEEVSRQHQHQFLNQHLDWIDDLLEEAQNEGLAAFYIDLLEWLLEFIRAEKEYLAAKSSTA